MIKILGKKLYFLLFPVALLCGLNSCGDDDDDQLLPSAPPATTVSMNVSKLVLYPGATEVLKPSHPGGTWQSGDKFVAEVDFSGSVTGEHVGSTEITYRVSGSPVSIRVSVVPSNENFVMPLLTWGASIGNIKGKIMNDYPLLTISDEKSDTSTIYCESEEDSTIYIYHFTLSKLTSAEMILPAEAAEEGDLDFWLSQYYLIKEESPEGKTYINAEKEDSATMLVRTSTEVSVYGQPGINISWTQR